MNRLKENMSYRNIIICDHCGKEVVYHVTDIKGVFNSTYIICPYCGKKVYITMNK